MIARRSVLKGAAATALATALPLGHVLAADEPGIRYGWDPLVDGGTDGDLVVSPDGDDSADGTVDAPLRTLSTGIDRLAALGGGTLLLRGGLYREAVSLGELTGSAAVPYRIRRYGTERPIVTAADLLAGWRACTADDTAPLGIAPDGLFVTELDRAALGHGTPFALNLHEDGEWLTIATDRADMTEVENASQYLKFHEAQPIVNASGLLAGFRDDRLRRFTPAQLAGARVLYYHAPNLVSPDPIGAFDPASGTITFAESGQKPQLVNKAPIARYALQNVATALSPGTWIVREYEPGRLTIFLRPRNPGLPDGRIEVSTRTHCIDIDGASHLELFGIEMVRAAGAERDDAAALRHRPAVKDKTPDRAILIEHCRVGETLSVAARGYGAAYFRDVTGLTIRNFTCDQARGSFGIFLNGCTNADLRYLHLAAISLSPARFFGLRNSIFAFSFLQDSGRDAHSNKFNFYEGSDAVLVYGIRTRNTGGYATFQEASRIHFAFCDLDASQHPTDSRSLVSQNRPQGAGQGGADGSGDPVAGGMFWFWNLTLPAKPEAPKPAKALLFGPGGSSQRYSLFNSVVHGGGFADVYLKKGNPAAERRSHNLYTGLMHWQTPKYGWKLGEAEATLPIGALPRARGRDMRAFIEAEIVPLFPAFTDWDRDIDYRRVDWSNPPIGARVY